LSARDRVVSEVAGIADGKNAEHAYC
jgi:hypothetical protein